jgi:hypothetical protein
MTELERRLLPTMEEYMDPWSRYVDDTITVIHKDSVERALANLNSFNKNIKFTYELETDNKIAFLDVMLMRQQGEIETTVYRKPTSNDIYIHWQSVAPKSWCFSTLKSLILRAYKVCSSGIHRELEIEHLRKAFMNVNGYPAWAITKMIKAVDEGTRAPEGETTTRPAMLSVPYKGKEGEKLIHSLNKCLTSVTTDDKSMQVVYKGTKLGSQFKTKDKTKVEHIHNIVYKVQCPADNCGATYVGETGRRLAVRAMEHGHRDGRSYVSGHSRICGHQPVSLGDFRVLTNNIRGSLHKRRIVEALYIRELAPTLNKQGASVQLSLFDKAVCKR